MTTVACDVQTDVSTTTTLYCQHKVSFNLANLVSGNNLFTGNSGFCSVGSCSSLTPPPPWPMGTGQDFYEGLPSLPKFPGHVTRESAPQGAMGSSTFF